MDIAGFISRGVFFFLENVINIKGEITSAIEQFEKLLFLGKDADKNLLELKEAKERMAKLK
jgi:hypothetical protein